MVAILKSLIAIEAGENLQDADRFTFRMERADIAIVGDQALAEGFGPGKIDPGEDPRFGISLRKIVTGGVALHHHQGVTGGTGHRLLVPLQETLSSPGVLKNKVPAGSFLIVPVIIGVDRPFQRTGRIEME